LALLRHNRTLLIEKINFANLGTLLDLLLDLEVLSESEKDFILESKSVKRDEVRTLIDMVKNKGEEAAKHFFNSLKKVNEALYKQIDTKSTQGPAGELISVTFCKFNLHIVSMRQ
uniref:CARD domain-containing protein n=1 Tax=Pundamilia nyererei TaxID=303518 RepID=A0A3B4HBY0_9CICH